MSLFKRFRTSTPPVAETPVAEPVIETTSKAKGFVPPPPRHMQPASDNPKVARLEQRRAAIEAGIEMVERSADPDSPFQQRIAVLGSTLDFIEEEIKTATPLEHRVLPSLPSTPITNVEVSLEPVPRVSFSIETNRFEYEEEIDWAERGTQIVHGDLVPVKTAADPLIPATMSGALRDELRAHLDSSLFAFATDLRDRSVEELPLPSTVTLADLAVPCPTCGDWQLWGGVCIRCLTHERRLHDLNAERTRVLAERTREIEARQKEVEELPIQRRRLAQTIADIQALQS